MELNLIELESNNSLEEQTQENHSSSLDYKWKNLTYSNLQKNTPHYVGLLHKHANSKNMTGIQETLHEIKGLVMMRGLQDLTNQILAIEHSKGCIVSNNFLSMLNEFINEMEKKFVPNS